MANARVTHRMRNGRKYYRVRWVNPQGEPKCKEVGLRKGPADDLAAEINASLRAGTYIDPTRGRMTVAVFGAQWLASKAAPGQSERGRISPKTYLRYEQVLRLQIVPTFGRSPLTGITYAATEVWLTKLLGEGLSGAAVAKAYRVLSMIVDFAVKDQRLPANPIKSIKAPTSKPRHKRYLTRDQLEALADACGSLRLAVLVLGYTGLRYSEMASLRVEDLNLLSRRLVVLRGKGDKERLVPIPKSLCVELSRACEGLAPTDYLFTLQPGVYLTNTRFRTVFNRAAAEVGLAGLIPHALRHTTASLAVSTGTNVKVVQRMLGHADATTTQRVYTHLFDKDLDTAADALDDLRTGTKADPDRYTDGTTATVTPITQRETGA